MTELSKCPFCGNEAKLMMADMESSPKEYWVRCIKRCIEQIGIFTEKEAIERWNKRV